MNLEGKVFVEGTKEEVWKALNNPSILQKATPGCKSLKEIEADHYKAKINLGIAAIRGEYEADLKILDKSEPDSYRLILHASSSVGFVEGEASVDLFYEAPKTCIRYKGNAQAGGLIAGVGQRVLSGIAKMIVKDFFKKIAVEVSENNAKHSF